jgi:hypothetical protein
MTASVLEIMSLCLYKGGIMKKFIAVILLAGMVLLAGCSMDDQNELGFTRSFGGYDDYDNEVGFRLNSLTSDEVGGAVAPDSQIERKVIRNAWLTLEAKLGQSATELYAQIVNHCNSLGGFEFSSEANHYEKYSAVSAVLKVPPEKLDEFMSFMGDSARIITSKMDSDDVTDQFYDMTTRLETKRRSLESYYVLLENADSLSDITSLKRTIDGIIEEIEAIEGRLRVMSSRIDMATVTLNIRQENDPTPEPRREIDWGALSLDDMGYFISSGFISVVNFLAFILQWLVIIAVTASPLWIPAGAVVLVRRKRRKAKLTISDEEEKSE